MDDKKIKVFFASSSKLALERSAFPNILIEIQKELTHLKIELEIEPIMWELDVIAGSVDKRFQDDINIKLKESELVIVVFYSEIGNFTLEEYKIAREMKKKVFIFFRTGFSPNETNIEAYSKVLDFKKKIKKEGDLLWVDYKDLNEFIILLGKNLRKYIFDRFKPEDINPLNSQIINNTLNIRKELLNEQIRERIWLNILLYKQESSINSKSYEQIEKGRSIDVRRVLGKNVYSVFRENNNVLLFGEAGSGKTTMMELLERRLLVTNSIWYIPLRLYSSSFIDTILKFYRNNSLSSAILENEFNSKDIILLIDGLNELTSNCVDSFFTELEWWLTVKSNNIKIWLTCRTQNRYDFQNRASLNKFKNYIVLPLTSNERYKILRRIFPNFTGEEIVKKEEEIKTNFGDAVNTPQFFCLIAEQIKEYSNISPFRTDIIINYIRLSYQKYLEKKNLKIEPIKTSFEVHRAIKLLTELAWITKNKSSRIFLTDANVRTILDNFKKINQIENIEEYFDLIIKWTPLELNTPDCISFQHDTFREAFCGIQILNLSNNILKEIIKKKEWRESFIFAAENSDLEQAIQLILILIESDIEDYDLCARICHKCVQKHNEKIKNEISKIVDWLLHKFEEIDISKEYENQTLDEYDYDNIKNYSSNNSSEIEKTAEEVEIEKTIKELERIREKLKMMRNTDEEREQEDYEQNNNNYYNYQYLSDKKYEILIAFSQLLNYLDTNSRSKIIAILVTNSRDFYHAGNKAYELGKYIDAIDCYSIAIELNENFSESYFNRGLCKYNLKFFKSAIEDYTASIKDDPNNPVIYNNRGDAFYRLQKFREAIIDYDKAIEINPKYLKAFYNRGLAKACLQDYKNSITDFLVVIELNPNFAEAHNILGLAYEYNDDDDNAIECYKKSIELNKNFTEAISNFFNLLWGKNRREEAQKTVIEWLGKGVQNIHEVIVSYLVTIESENYNEEELFARLNFLQLLLNTEIENSNDNPKALTDLHLIIERYLNLYESGYPYLERQDIMKYDDDLASPLWTVINWANNFSEVYKEKSKDIIDGLVERLLVFSLPAIYNGILWRIGLIYIPISLDIAIKFFRHSLEQVVPESYVQFPIEPIRLDLARILLKQKKFDEATNIAKEVIESVNDKNIISDALFILATSNNPETALDYLENKDIQIRKEDYDNIMGIVLSNSLNVRKALENLENQEIIYSDKSYYWWNRSLYEHYLSFYNNSLLSKKKNREIDNTNLEDSLMNEISILLSIYPNNVSKNVAKLKSLLFSKEHKYDIINYYEIILCILEKRDIQEIKEKTRYWFHNYKILGNITWDSQVELILCSGIIDIAHILIKEIPEWFSQNTNKYESILYELLQIMISEKNSLDKRIIEESKEVLGLFPFGLFKCSLEIENNYPEYLKSDMQKAYNLLIEYWTPQSIENPC